jgi:hypothetical protein
MPGQVRFAFSDLGHLSRFRARQRLRVQDTGSAQAFGVDVVTGAYMTAYAWLVGCMLVMREAAIDVVPDVGMTCKAALVRNLGVLRQGEKRFAGSVDPDLFESDDLVAHALRESRVHMTFDAADPVVRTLLPCFVVGAHLVTTCAEARLFCRLGYSQHSKEGSGDHSDEHECGDSGMGTDPRVELLSH